MEDDIKEPSFLNMLQWATHRGQDSFKLICCFYTWTTLIKTSNAKETIDCY